MALCVKSLDTSDTNRHCARLFEDFQPNSASFLQVDSSETLSDSDPEGKALTEVHSIGVQVEEDKR